MNQESCMPSFNTSTARARNLKNKLPLPKLLRSSDVLPHKAKLHCILNVVADLMEQGWSFDFDQEKEKWFVFFNENSSGGKSSEEVKNEMRASFLVGVKESFKKGLFRHSSKRCTKLQDINYQLLIYLIVRKN